VHGEQAAGAREEQHAHAQRRDDVRRSPAPAQNQERDTHDAEERRQTRDGTVAANRFQDVGRQRHGARETGSARRRSHGVTRKIAERADEVPHLVRVPPTRFELGVDQDELADGPVVFAQAEREGSRQTVECDRRQ